MAAAEPPVGDLTLHVDDSGTVHVIESLLLFDDGEYDTDRRTFDVWHASG